jgi:four helix bundle protein
MPYANFTDYPLWKEASALTDSIFDFSRGIEDFSLRNRMTGAAVEIPFLLGEAAQSQTDEQMKNTLWRVEDPVNELRSVLTESKEQGFAPDADYEMMQERCRDLFQKVHKEASSPTPVIHEKIEKVSEDPEPTPELLTEKIAEAPMAHEAAKVAEEKAVEKKPSPEAPSIRKEKTKPAITEDDEFNENALI